MSLYGVCKHTVVSLVHYIMVMNVMGICLNLFCIFCYPHMVKSMHTGSNI